MEFITHEERERLEAQLNELKSRRKTLSDRIGAARELGDLKENADYHAAREEQGLNEAKIRQLEQRLASTSVVDTDAAMPEDVVFVGAMVRLRDVDNDDEDLYRLVGQATNDFSLDYVEVTTTSPMGQALMRARVGETVRVVVPKGEKHFEILEIVR